MDWAGFFAAARPQREAVTVRGMTVHVWEVNAGQRLELEAAGKNEDTRESVLSMVALCLGDENGPKAPPFTREEIAAMGGTVITRLYLAALKLNRMTQEAAEEQRGN